MSCWPKSALPQAHGWAVPPNRSNWRMDGPALSAGVRSPFAELAADGLRVTTAFVVFPHRAGTPPPRRAKTFELAYRFVSVGGAAVRCREVFGTPMALSPSRKRGQRDRLDQVNLTMRKREKSPVRNPKIPCLTSVPLGYSPHAK